MSKKDPWSAAAQETYVELEQIIRIVIGLYVAGALLLLGFAMMLGGALGAQRVARWYFGGSWRWALRAVRALLRGTLRSFASIYRALARAVRRAHARRRMRQLRG
jgi:hypothetical protein